MRRIAIILIAAYAGSMLLESFTVADMGSLTRVVGYLAFIVGVASMLTQPGVQPPGIGHMLLTGFVCFSLMSVLWSVDPDMTLDRTYMYSMQLAFLWLVLQVVQSQEDINTIMGGFVIGAFFAALGNLHAFDTGGHAAGGRYSATDLDPNEFALMVTLSIPMSWYLGFSAKKPLVRAFFQLAPLVMIPGIVLTGSRGGTLSMMAALLIIPLCFNRITPLAKGTVLVTATAAFVGGAALLPEAILKRLSSIATEATSGSMAGRREIWAAGWEQFKNHPILGVGTGAFAESINIANSKNPVAHNTYLSVAAELGVIGFLFFFLAVVRMGYEILRMPKPDRWLWMTVLLSWMIGVGALTWEHTKPTWLIFALILVRAKLFDSEYQASWGETEELEDETMVALQG
jgi:O-antigen ligase